MRRPRFVYKMAYPVKQGSDYTPFFNMALLQMQQSENKLLNVVT